MGGRCDGAHGCDFSALAQGGKLLSSPFAGLGVDWDQAVNLVNMGVIRLDNHANNVVKIDYYDQAWDSLAKREHLAVLLNANEELTNL